MLPVAPAHAPLDRRILMGGIVALAVLAGVFLWAVTGQGSFAGTWSALTLPSELKSGTFTTDDMKEYEIAFGRYSVLKDTEAAQAVKEVLAAGSSTTTKSGAVRSPDGKTVAFTEQFAGMEGSRNPSDWRIVIANATTKEAFRLSSGFAPFFIDDTHLAWFTNVGIVERDLASGETKVLYERAFNQTFPLGGQSPDRTQVAWFDRQEKAVIVYRVSEDPAIVHTAPAYAGGIVLGTNNLYYVFADAKGTSILRFIPGKTSPVVVHRIPASLSITAITL